jgi:purine-binding chemotaxis protein CheW
MDLSARFGRPATPLTKKSCIVIVELTNAGERQVIGVAVDAVNAVLDIPATEIEPAPAFGARIRGDYILGMGKVDAKFVILLNVDKVLALDVAEAAPEAAPAPALAAPAEQARLAAPADAA